MKNSKAKIKTITIIVLIGIIISLIFVILNMNNKNIIAQEMNKEQLGELNNSNTYVDMSTHLSEVNSKQQELDNLQNTVGQATATADKILKDYTAYKDGQLITGTMANNGAVLANLNAGASYMIPAGYHNGSGKVTANSLASQTSANATATQILSGQTAWVNGSKVTGTMVNNGAITKTLNAGASYTIPAGYHNGTGKITAISTVNYDNLIGHFTTTSASKKYGVANGSASATVTSSTNIDYSLYNFIEINYTAIRANRGSATIALGSKRVSVWNTGTNIIAIPVYDLNEKGIFQIYVEDEGGGTATSGVGITINSIKGYK